MRNRLPFYRRKFLINKKFQIDFAVRFLVLIVLAAVGALVMFFMSAKGTLTTSYSGSEISILRTSEYFLPVLILSSIGVIIVVGIIAIMLLIYLSHRISGPIFRFETVMEALDKGDLTHRFKIRKTDQFTELAQRINDLAVTMDARIGTIKGHATASLRLASELEKAASAHPSLEKDLNYLLLDINRQLTELHDAADHFKTTRDV
jgi:methyl-accepting chemotaxis protein